MNVENRNGTILEPQEGGTIQEIVSRVAGWRRASLALMAPTLAMGMVLDPRTVKAEPSQATIENFNPQEATLDFAHMAPEILASGSGSSQIDKHCDEVEGQKRFEGWIKGETLERHTYKRQAYAKAQDGKMYLCFSVPADEGKPYEHWTARYVGPENWFKEGKKVTSRDLNNCPTVNPCK